MRTYQIAFLTGDGVGPVMARAGQELLERLGRAHGFQVRPALFPFGKGAYEACGTPLPPETAEGIQASDAALCAAVDAHGIPGPTPVGMLRKSLDLFADVRPIRARPGRWALRPDLDLVVVREVTQGFLSDRNLYQGGGEWMSDADTAFSLRVISYEASPTTPLTTPGAAAGKRSPPCTRPPSSS